MGNDKLKLMWEKAKDLEITYYDIQYPPSIDDLKSIFVERGIGCHINKFETYAEKYTELFEWCESDEEKWLVYLLKLLHYRWNDNKEEWSHTQ